ncbi:unnamed protein product [Adineta ricciae]|uniref:Partial AB-hydrolase lipase domain-containing protein n=1 Tax=Adineta ricciae TaxID=249248 RepID=A0A815MSP4_ADIRI|nr:unnamed protein product [Adineta ricciae]CAF1428657.1 unnamed protein product [Adineta ricciae]
MRYLTSDLHSSRIITQLTESKGYPWKEYKVIIPDGYILGVYRFPRGRNASTAFTVGPPVFPQHGLLNLGATWVIIFPGQNLSFILAAADDDEEFWDSNYDEMAHLDLPSMIYFVLNATKRTQIGYVGHSQGGMIGFAEFGRLESTMKNNVSFWIVFTPAGRLGNIQPPIR